MSSTTHFNNTCHPNVSSTPWPDFAVLRCSLCHTFGPKIPTRRGHPDYFMSSIPNPDKRFSTCSLCAHDDFTPILSFYRLRWYCWCCYFEIPANSHWFPTQKRRQILKCERCMMTVDGSSLMGWEKAMNHKRGEVDMEKEEDMWRRANSRAKKDWEGVKACVDVGDVKRTWVHAREEKSKETR